MRQFTLLLALALTGLQVQAQPDKDQLLANQYFVSGEFEKAVVLYEKLYQNNPTSAYLYRYYFNCLVELERYSDAEKLVKKEIKKQQDNLTLLVDLGYLTKTAGDQKKADKQFGEVIDKLPADRTNISQTANALANIKEFGFASQAYEKGAKLLRGQYDFSFERATLARQTGDVTTMIARFLDYLVFDPSQSERVRTVFHDQIGDEAFTKNLTGQLYQRIQSSPDEVVFTETLVWVLIQKRDFTGALRQVRALDRRLREQGRKVHELALTLMAEREYDVAVEAYQYLIDQGRNAAFYFYGREGLLRARKAKITSTFTFTLEDINKLKSDYESFLTELGFNKVQSAPTRKELAHLEAFYLHDTERAIEILEDLIKTPGLTPRLLAESKLDLGDYYLLLGDLWEATLLYSQVDKQMKDDPLGEEARYRNAKWSYYHGDFLWAQAQLNVLKASTSELIANDALSLSVFITDHLGLDSTSVPMEMFARADLLAFQNKHFEAIAALDSLERRFPGHTLQDDIYLLKSNIWLRRHEVKTAVEFLEKIINGHPGSILIDDALFKLGDLYEHHFKEPDKAMGFYERILLEQKGSIFVVEARNRYRALRGDTLN